MDRADSSSPEVTGPCPPIGVRRAGVRFRLHPRWFGEDVIAPAGTDPLVRQFPAVASFRSYVASVELAGRELIPFVTVLLQPNEYPGVRGGAVQPGATNAQIEKVWSEAFRSLSAFQGEGIARIESRAVASDAPVSEAPRTGPLAWCRKMGEYIEPVCPSCLGRFSVCRDETLLRTSGLPAFATSQSRYLYCPVCSAETERPPTFYTYSLRDGETPPAGVRVRRRSEIYRDLATAIQVGTGTPDGEHFCFECMNRMACYPPGRSIDAPVPAEDLLYPLAYYESSYIPVEPCPLDFAETAALLGGASAADLKTLMSVADDPADRLKAAQLDRLDAAGRQFFFQGDSSGLFALEALLLKLGAFLGLVEGVRDLVLQAGRPHLSLGPDRIRGRLLLSGSEFLPTRWGLSLAAGDLLTTARLELFEPVPGEPPVWSIPFPLTEPFVPDGLSRIQSESLFMRLNPRDVRIENGPAGPLARVTAELTADGYRESDHGRHDLVRLAADMVQGMDGRIILAGRKIGALPRGFMFEGTSAPLSPENRAAFEAKRFPSSWSVEATIVHTFAAPADVVSLGVLLLRLLLTNDRQDGSNLDRESAERLANAVSGSRAGDPSTRFREAFARESIQADPAQVLFRESDRKLASPAIPAMLWEETVELALRMASNIPGWSVTASQDDYEDERPARALERAIEELMTLIERARGGLIGSSGRNGMVLEVCDDFLDDFREASGRKGQPAEDAPHMTVVVSPQRRGG